MNLLAFLRPLWSGPPRKCLEAWFLVFWVAMLIWSVPFAVTQVGDWRSGVPDAYHNQHVRLAVGSVDSVVLELAAILILTRRRVLMWVFVLGSWALLMWSKSLR